MLSDPIKWQVLMVDIVCRPRSQQTVISNELSHGSGAPVHVGTGNATITNVKP